MLYRCKHNPTAKLITCTHIIKTLLSMEPYLSIFVIIVAQWHIQQHIGPISTVYNYFTYVCTT